MRSWTLVALLWVVYFINYIDRQVAFSVFPSLRQELGFTNAELGLIGTVFTWVYSIFMPFSGRLADLVRRERIIVVSLALWSLCTLGTGMSGSVTEFLWWRAAMGVTESLYVPAALGLLASILPAESRSKGLAVHMTAQLVGIAAGGWFGGWAADSLGWRRGFRILAVAGLVYAVVLGLAIVRFRLPKPEPSTQSASGPFDVIRSRCFLALAVAFLLFCAVLWVQYAWLANHMYEQFSLSMTQAGFTAMVFLQGSTAAGVLLGGFAGDRITRSIPAGRLYVVALGVILSAPFAYVTFATGSLFAAVASACSFGLFSGLMMSNIFAAAYDVVAPQNYGFSAGMLNLVGGLAGGAGILGAGVWKDSAGISVVAGSTGVAALLAGIVLALVVVRWFPAEWKPAAA
jgi:MFS transporter, Spinster family, sphingosine-1-phosphate transporter